LNHRQPADSGGSGSLGRQPLTCQMAGSNYENFGKIRGKGLNCLE